MKTTTYICDVCKQSKSEEDIIPISVSYSVTQPGQHYKNNRSKSKDVCKSCLDKRGLMTEWPTENVDGIAAKTDKSFEDKLVDLLCDLGVLFES